MSQNPAYKQLLTLIVARSQQWLRTRLDRMPAAPRTGDPAVAELAEIAVAANICSGLRGTEVPLETFLRSRFTPAFIAELVLDFQDHPSTGGYPGAALFRFLPPPEVMLIDSRGRALPDRLALSDPASRELLDEAELFLCRSVPDECLTEDIVDGYARVLALCYRFGAERPRFASARTYGEAFATCLRLADWAQRKGRLRPLAQMCLCLCLIDPDHDASPMLADIIASQRPDGSFPARLGFGTADQDSTALRPTLATLVTLHLAVYGRGRSPGPTLPIAA